MSGNPTEPTDTGGRFSCAHTDGLMLGHKALGSIILIIQIKIGEVAVWVSPQTLYIYTDELS